MAKFSKGDVVRTEATAERLGFEFTVHGIERSAYGGKTVYADGRTYAGDWWDTEYLDRIGKLVVSPAVEQQDDSEFDRERADQDRARIAAGEAQPMAAQGVEAWGVYLNQHPIYVNFSREPELGCGETVRRVRVVPVDDTKLEPAGSGFKETAENLNEQPAEDAERVDVWRNKTHAALAVLGEPFIAPDEWQKGYAVFPKPAPATTDGLETVIRKTLEGFEPEGNASDDEVTEIAAAVRAHYEGTGE